MLAIYQHAMSGVVINLFGMILDSVFKALSYNHVHPNSEACCRFPGRSLSLSLQQSLFDQSREVLPQS